MIRPHVMADSVAHQPPQRETPVSLSGHQWRGAARLADLVDPAVRVGALAVLDAHQFLAQLERHRPRRAVADDPFRRGPLDLADGRDHGGGAAGEHLGQLTGLTAGPPRVSRDLAFLDLVAEVPAE